MTVTAAVEEVVLGMWAALSRRDWVGIKAFLAEDCIYADMPLGPAHAARGPDDIVKRIQPVMDTLASYRNNPGLVVCTGKDVMFEHSENWEWTNGFTAELRFVTVHEVVDGKITVWKDYWDYGSLLNHAPDGWVEQMATNDMSWAFDATGLI